MKRSDIRTVDVLKACYESHKEVNNPSAVEILMNSFKYPEKLVLSAMERDSDRGFIEYGVTLGAAWLTMKGAKKLCYT